MSEQKHESREPPIDLAALFGVTMLLWLFLVFVVLALMVK